MYWIGYIFRKCGSVVKFKWFGDSKIKFQENWLTQAKEILVGKWVVWQSAKQHYTESWQEPRGAWASWVVTWPFIRVQQGCIPHLKEDIQSYLLIYEIDFFFEQINTEMRFILWTWFREFCSCCSLTALPGPAWVLLNWICKELISSLYISCLFFSCAGLMQVSSTFWDAT